MENGILELIRAATNFLNSSANVEKSWLDIVLTSPAISTLIGALIALAGTFASVWVTEKRKAKELNAEKCEKQLMELYNPLVFLLERTTAIYELFNLEEKRTNPGVKTLDLLLDGHSFSAEDNYFLEEIIEHNKKIEKLISDHSGYIDKELMEPLVKLVEHYDLIERAKRGELSQRAEYRSHTYPKDVVSKVKEKQEELYNKLESYRK